jgi:N6-adenosine-specific RNA methylase IME4
MTEMLPLGTIRVDGGTQSRASLYQNVVDDYAEAIQAGAVFPPIIVFYDGAEHWLADGFHRHAAFAKAGWTLIDVDVRQGTRRDAILYSVGANETHGLRRTAEDKRRAVLTLLEDVEWSAWSDREIARRCVVSHDTVGRLRSITGRSSSERAYKTKHGTKSTMDVSKRPARAFDPHQEREHREAAKKIKTERQRDKADAREAKEVELTEKIEAASAALGSGQLFGVIYADPPWRFEPYSRETGMDRAADNHYPTMDLADILAMQVPAADDCVLFLWATAPMLPQALAVMDAWGFAYKSHIIWLKDRIGTGYWARNKHELLLIGVRGSIPAPLPGTQPESVVAAPVARHSTKPAVFAELIEKIYPTLPKIELFSRAARPGWHGWGAEALANLPSHDPVTGEIFEPEPAIVVAPASPQPKPNIEPVRQSDLPRAIPQAALPLDPPSVPAEPVPERPVANERCQKLKKDCSWAFHPNKISCSTCSTAWSLSQKKAAAAGDAS